MEECTHVVEGVCYICQRKELESFDSKGLLELMLSAPDAPVVSGEDYDLMRERTQQVAINALNDLQGRLRQWQQENFDPETTGAEWMALGATEELGEVAHILVKAKQRIRQHQAGLTDETLNEVADGVADCVIYLMQLCSHLGIDFARALFFTAETVMQRNWRTNKTDGVSK